MEEGGVEGWGVYHVPYSEAQGGRDYNEVYLYGKLSIYVILSEGHVGNG